MGKARNTFAEKNAQLFEKYGCAKKDDDEGERIRVRNEIVELNWLYVKSLISKWWKKSAIEPRHLSIEDMTQAAFFSMCRAIDKFEPERGFSFTTYMFHWVRHAIQRTLVLDNIVHCPVHNFKFEKMSYLDAMEVDSKEWLIDKYGVVEPVDALYERMERKILSDYISANLRNWLTERSAYIVEHCFLKGESLGTIGKVFGISKERVRQLRNSAVKQLGDRCEDGLASIYKGRRHEGSEDAGRDGCEHEGKVA